jgi:hypothetical protein
MIPGWCPSPAPDCLGVSSTRLTSRPSRSPSSSPGGVRTSRPGVPPLDLCTVTSDQLRRQDDGPRAAMHDGRGCQRHGNPEDPVGGIMWVIFDHLRPSGHIMPDHGGDRGAVLLILAPHDHLHIKHERTPGADSRSEIPIAEYARPILPIHAIIRAWLTATCARWIVNSVSTG